MLHEGRSQDTALCLYTRVAGPRTQEAPHWRVAGPRTQGAPYWRVAGLRTQGRRIGGSQARAPRGAVLAGRRPAHPGAPYWWVAGPRTQGRRIDL